MKVYKADLIREIADHRFPEYQASGWRDSAEDKLPQKPAKSKGADKSLDNANLTQGDDDGNTDR